VTTCDNRTEIPSMFRFVGFKTVEDDDEMGPSLLLDKVPYKKDLLGETKIARFCSGF
jgi:hypothetical protein